MDKLLRLIEKDCRYTPEQLAAMCGLTAGEVRQKIDEYNQHGNANPGKHGFTPITLSEEGLETLEAIAADCTSAEGPFHADRDLRIDKSGKVIIDGKKTNALWDGTLALPSKPLRLRFRNICGDETVLNVTV